MHTARAPRLRLPLAIYGLAAFNIAALWIGRGEFVPGWDLFGATFGVLALGETSTFYAALTRITHAFLNQKHRPVFTGGESYIYGLVPGLLNQITPWLLWGHLVCLTLLVAIAWWMARRFRAPAWLLWACILSSPALVSQSIVGLPHLTSAAIPFGLAIGWVLTETDRCRGVVAGLLLDTLVFATITFIAFNGYESGKTFFVVPVLGALTLRGIPVVRRLGWLAWAAAAAWLVHDQQPMTTEAALASIPHDPAAFVQGLSRIPRRYFVDWWIDFPALFLAAVIGLFRLRSRRLFWLGLFAASAGLVSLSAFQFGGGFLSPPRFLLLIFVSALVVTVALSEGGAGRVTNRAIILLLATGIGYTTYLTVRFVRERPSNEVRDYNQNHVYPLPYNHSGFENQLWRDRIQDAITVVDAIKRGDEPHLFFYGFSVLAEDGVNPQLFVSRVLLPLGYPRFTERVRFFDHSGEMFFPFPVRPLVEVPEAMWRTRVPFFVHVREPEYSGAAVLAKYLNRARVTPVDLGLRGFQSYRVDAFEPPGPIPVQPLEAAAATRISQQSDRTVDGFCLTTWRQDEGAYPLSHWEAPLPRHLDRILAEAAAARGSARYIDVTRRIVGIVNERFTQAAAAHFLGYFDNQSGGPLPVSLALAADDEVALVLNGQVIEESLRWQPSRTYTDAVVLPPGWNELRIAYHKFWNAGGVSFASTDAAGHPLGWRCTADFH